MAPDPYLMGPRENREIPLRQHFMAVRTEDLPCKPMVFTLRFVHDSVKPCVYITLET